MTRPVRLLALDIDGTLLRSDKTVSARTRAAVNAARARGVRLVLATGRRYPSARNVAEDLGGELALVLHNGALVVDGREVVRVSPLGLKAAVRALRAGRDQGFEPVVHTGHAGEGTLLVAEAARGHRLVAYYLDRNAQDVRFVPDLESALAEDPIQVMYGGSVEEMEAVFPALEAVLAGEARIERTVYPRNGRALLDVIAAGVGKAEALAFLQNRYTIEPEETLAIGDNWNDREMLESAGIGYLMSNADPALLALPLPRLPSNDEDGVAQAIEKHILR